MKVLLDTCVVVDFLQNREPFAKDAFKLFELIACGRFEGYITAKSATDIYYLAHKCTHSNESSRNMLGRLLSLVGVIDNTASDIFNSLASKISDFEDSVMIEAAVRSKISCIVTRNQKDYKDSPVPVFSPSDLVARLETEQSK